MEQFEHGQLRLVILGLLQREGELYGYAIRKVVSKMTNGHYELKEGTLYPLLRLLEEQELVQHKAKPSPFGPSRKSYTLTDKGHKYMETLRKYICS